MQCTYILGANMLCSNSLYGLLFVLEEIYLVKNGVHHVLGFTQHYKSLVSS